MREAVLIQEGSGIDGAYMLEITAPDFPHLICVTQLGFKVVTNSKIVMDMRQKQEELETLRFQLQPALQKQIEAKRELSCLHQDLPDEAILDLPQYMQQLQAKMSHLTSVMSTMEAKHVRPEICSADCDTLVRLGFIEDDLIAKLLAACQQHAVSAVLCKDHTQARQIVSSTRPCFVELQVQPIAWEAVDPRLTSATHEVVCRDEHKNLFACLFENIALTDSQADAVEIHQHLRLHKQHCPIIVVRETCSVLSPEGCWEQPELDSLPFVFGAVPLLLQSKYCDCRLRFTEYRHTNTQCQAWLDKDQEVKMIDAEVEKLFPQRLRMDDLESELGMSTPQEPPRTKRRVATDMRHR